MKLSTVDNQSNGIKIILKSKFLNFFFKDQDRFEKDGLNSFSFDNMDVGEISSVELGVRNQEEKWFVKYLEVHLPLKAKTHVFEINNWFCRTEGDGLLVRKFDISGKNFNPNFKPIFLSNIENFFFIDSL